MEGWPGPDFEIRFQEHGAFIDAHFAPAPMHRIRWIGMNERAGGHRSLPTIRVGEALARRRRRKYVGEKEETKRDAEAGAQNSAEQEYRDAAPKTAHDGQSALGSRRMVNSMRSPGSTRQLSIS